ncbi:hypothetical protein O1611_g6986 [Lasiodiplodia mahajangana]|uniref:Uncharacterized protein n=1 Tax=Lasiodiplodia mahajangana TaxID=1108764 RepID=A0ACC2JGL1_9PEZI|nr:hypothetical protein O1611_g6986 [Lasiodiplodia mahajangana]
MSPLPTLGRPSTQKLRERIKVPCPHLTGYQSTRSASAPPQPTRVFGRQPCRLPKLPGESSVRNWLDSILSPNPRLASPSPSRPSSCPPTLDLTRGRHAPPSLAEIRQILHNEEDSASNAGTAHSDRHSTSHPLYRGTLYNNNVKIDYSGRMIPSELQVFVESLILKRRGSPQLTDEDVNKIIDVAEELADSTDGPVAKLMRTEMFPFDRPGIVEGGKSPWSTIALPDNPDYQYCISVPEPDAHFGYPTYQRSCWSTSQSNVITHPMARPYTQPATGNIFPFVSVEMKSEATGGTLYVAENQAAGSGTHCVNSLLWLLRQAGMYNDSIRINTVAFTIAISQRLAVFYIHWHSEDDHRHYMSMLSSYSTLVPSDIRLCNNTVKNILDYGLGQRKTTISAALEALSPLLTKLK